MGKDFVAERLQILKKARQIALQDSFKAGTTYKEAHDKKASQHKLAEGDYAYLDNQLFLGKIKKCHNYGLGPI
jgi:hypothetical protein